MMSLYCSWQLYPSNSEISLYHGIYFYNSRLTLSNVDTKHTNEVQAIEYHTEMNVAVDPSSDTKTAEIHEDDCESADEIDEDEFKGKFLPEKHMQELAVNFVSARHPEA